MSWRPSIQGGYYVVETSGADDFVRTICEVRGMDTPEETRQVTHLLAAAQEMREALAGVMQLIAVGKLIRCTSEDANPDFAMRQLPFVMALSAAEKALAKARGESHA